MGLITLPNCLKFNFFNDDFYPFFPLWSSSEYKTLSIKTVQGRDCHPLQLMVIYEMLSSLYYCIYMTVGQTNVCIIDQNQRQKLLIEMMSEEQTILMF